MTIAHERLDTDNDAKLRGLLAAGDPAGEVRTAWHAKEVVREIYTIDDTEIAAELYLGEATIKTHVGRILSKLGARDRVQAVVIAYESGLVTPGDN